MQGGQQAYENYDYLFNTPLSQFNMQDIGQQYTDFMNAMPGVGLIHKPLDDLIKSLTK